MKAIVYSEYGTPEVLSIAEVAKPTPKDNEVLVKIHATTVTAMDCIFRRGDAWTARMGVTGLRKPMLPVLGTEFAGVVEAIGKGVTRFKVGDQVAGGTDGAGTYAENICVAEDGILIAKSAEITFEQAAVLPYGAGTAWHFITRLAESQRGHKMLINGASGSIGSYAVQFAKQAGAEVTAVCSAPKFEMVQALGADKVIDYKSADFTQNGERYDTIFDAVGTLRYSRCKSSLKADGRFLVTGLSWENMLQMFWTAKLSRKKSIVGFAGLQPAQQQADDLSLIQEMVVAGSLTPIIDKRFALEEIAAAHRYIEAGHKRGNVVVTVH